jgi:hypothetical protein
VNFDCYFYSGHSQYNTENVSWVLEPQQPMLPFSVISVLLNQFTNPATDQFQAVLEIKGQNFDEVNREWVTNHFQRELLFIAEDKKTAESTFLNDQVMIVGSTK